MVWKLKLQVSSSAEPVLVFLQIYSRSCPEQIRMIWKLKRTASTLSEEIQILNVLFEVERLLKVKRSQIRPLSQLSHEFFFHLRGPDRQGYCPLWILCNVLALEVFMRLRDCRRSPVTLPCPKVSRTGIEARLVDLMKFVAGELLRDKRCIQEAFNAHTRIFNHLQAFEQEQTGLDVERLCSSRNLILSSLYLL